MELVVDGVGAVLKLELPVADVNHLRFDASAFNGKAVAP